MDKFMMVGACQYAKIIQDAHPEKSYAECLQLTAKSLHFNSLIFFRKLPVGWDISDPLIRYIIYLTNIARKDNADIAPLLNYINSIYPGF